MTATALQTFTVIGLRSDVDMRDLFVAAVLPGPVADDIVILTTSEDDFTRWALEFDASDADAAAAQAYAYCATTAGDRLRAALHDAGIYSIFGGELGAGSDWVNVATATGEILITGSGDTENELFYDLDAHEGWYAAYYGASGDPAELHTGQPDFETDTAAVVETVRGFLAAERDAAAETGQNAGAVLRAALAQAGIQSSTDGHPSAGCFWVVVDCPDGSFIWINGTGRTENLTDYAPARHDGWLACHYPDPEDTGTFTVLHDGSRDFDADTAAVVSAVREFLPTLRPWSTT
ncbi:hypothetical protein [Streptomyces lutosisoli]|uniref:Uncharacterized protein n=1 Tax=Streptomyces lutosisoli TaxID=2665721 RepID=A0ABW2VZ68_9ACTN